MESTDSYPLAYFEYIFDEKNTFEDLENVLQYFESYIICESGEIKCAELNEFGEIEHNFYHSKDILLTKFFQEAEKTKNYLYNFSITNTTLVTENYLTIQVRILQNLIDNNYVLINRRNYYILPIHRIISYINDVLLPSGMKEFVLDESKIFLNIPQDTNQIVFKTERLTDVELIHSIFYYMKGLNEKREKILSDEDYELLIMYTIELIEKEEVPTITKKLKPNISNDLLRFSYWVLHKQIYSTKKIREYFYTFIKAAFENFNESSIKSIQNQFGTTTRGFNDNFIPEIISKYRK